MIKRRPWIPFDRPHLRSLLRVIALACLAIGCRTPDGPHHPIPDQSLSTPVPQGLTRVIFLNTNFQDEGVASGPIRIRFDGRQIPSVWPERYVQAFVKPGEYDFDIEQSTGFFWKRSHRVAIEGDEVLISVYTTPFSFFPSYEILDKLPSDFDEAFQPGRHPESW